MEHAQRVIFEDEWPGLIEEVLILILMEHAQRDSLGKCYVTLTGLNPYFNGTCSKRKGILLSDDEAVS